MRVRVVWKSKGLLSHGQGTEAEAPPRALVDLRAQVLWGVDDGPRSLAQSTAMLQVAADHGTTDIVVAPRASFEYPFDPSLIARRVEEIRAHWDGPVRIHTGCAFHFGLGNIRDALANPHKYTINGGNHLLVEFPDVMVPPASEDILNKVRAKGIVPIICHPERNPILQRSPERLQAWISMGCLLQVTARSISGHFGKTAQQCAWYLIRVGMVHVIASAAFDASHRPRVSMGRGD
jgi:protein-tyrosine phosphatase